MGGGGKEEEEKEVRIEQEVEEEDRVGDVGERNRGGRYGGERVEER